ncbi:MAG TPA: HEAT repeat domain-containing protein [Polyangia bacterium]|nr:HEAT repeat domain-containing protein [Polyangia bacterium]
MTDRAAAPLTFSPDELQRAERVDQLAALGPSSISELIQMLDDPSWPVRRAVVAALAAAGAPALEPLCTVLQTRRDSEARIAATVDALSAFSGDDRVDAAVAALVRNGDPAVLADVAQILGRRRTVSRVPTLVQLTRHADDNVAVAAIEALGRVGGRAAVESLVGAVESGNFFRIFPAIDVLGRSGDPRAVEPLARLLDTPQYAAEAARALGRTGDAAAVAPLARLLSSASGTMVRVAALALTDLQQRHRERFGSDDAIVKDLAVAAAADTSDTTVRQLTRALSGGDIAEQVAICAVLGNIQQPAAAAALSGLLTGPPEVATAAAAALHRLGSSVETQMLNDLRNGDTAKRRALLPLVSRAAAAGAVAQCLDDQDPEVRALACDALGRLGVTSLVGAIFPLLGDPNPRVSFAAIGAIQSLGSRETERLAIAAARSEDAVVRRAALRILSYFGSASVLDDLLGALNDADERVRESAIQGLPLMDDPRALEALLATAKAPSPRTRAAAMRALGRCPGDLRVTSYLLKGLADEDSWVRYYACQALGKLAFEPAATPLTRLLSDPAGQVRVAAVEALSCLKGETATRALEQMLLDPDPDIQRAAIIGVGIGQQSAALPLVLDAVKSPDPATRLVALSAVAAFRSTDLLPTLQRAATDPDQRVRSAALGFVAATPGAAATQVLVDLLSTSSNPDEVVNVLSLHVEGRIPALAAALTRADDERAAAITSVLARLRRPDATSALLAALKGPNTAARKAAATALAGIQSPNARAALRAAMDSDPEPEVRQICALLLAR